MCFSLNNNTTGDNILTAINVAGKCGMIEPCDTVIKVTAPSVDNDKDQQGKLVYTRLTRDQNSNEATQVEITGENCNVGRSRAVVLMTQSGLSFNLGDLSIFNRWRCLEQLSGKSEWT